MHRRPNHQPPLIIVGMHRSGTTMITDMLGKLGLFIGEHTEENRESIFFIELNRWMLGQANAAWDNPRPFLFTGRYLKDHLVRVMDLHLSGMRRLQFLGLKKFLAYRDIRSLAIPWGWKDPANTFTVDIWKELFPHARLLHIYRNPLDIAASLRKREEALKQEFRRTLKTSLKEHLLACRMYYQCSQRIQDVREGVRLWEEYVGKALSLSSVFGDKMLHVCYESFLEDPEKTLREIASFAGLAPDHGELLSLVGSVRHDRKFAFIRDPGLSAIYAEIRGSELMKQCGYHAIT